MDIGKRIAFWLGFTSPKWLHAAMARRNMPIIAVGSLMAASFAAMLAICLFANIPCPVDEFSTAAYANPGVTFRYKVTSTVATVLLLLIAAFAFLYIRKKWNRPGIATAVSIVFVFILSMLWGIAESGVGGDRQVLIFASIQFLAAGLLVFDPVVSLAFFAGIFTVFGTSLSLSGLLTDALAKDLVYLALLDIVVCWVVYGLFLKSTERERAMADISRRDELTGAKNRHCLRDDFPTFNGKELFVMFCDIDNFKHCNDDYSHAVGDSLLKQFFYALREAYGDECVYRYGGDEFLVVSPDIDAIRFEQKGRKAADQLAQVDISGAPAGLTYSGGYVHGEAKNQDSFREMLHSADANLLQAKRSGKNRILGPLGA